MRYFIELSYKGTSFCGWQIQPNAPTIQEEIEKALALILRKEIRITGSSRTDTGVHAAQQFAHFDTDEPLTNFEHLVYRLNAVLPSEIAIQRIFLVNDDAHSRFDAKFRKYTYRITLLKNPFFIDTSYYYNVKLDLESMNKACALMMQHTDFQCFSKVKTDVNTFDCTISHASWEQKETMTLFHIQANRFLRGMVRAIVGTMLEIGQGRMSLDEFEQIILSKNRNKAGRAAPANGLTLEVVGYTNL